MRDAPSARGVRHNPDGRRRAGSRLGPDHGWGDDERQSTHGTAAQYNASNPPGSLAHAVSAATLSTDTAFRVASEAVQIHGGNGLRKAYVVEEIPRDARASMIEDGTNEVRLLRGAAYP